MHTKEKQANILLITIGSLLFSYTAVRAMLLSITWDEAYTYIEFARNGRVILESYDMMSANNHILNTFGMMIFTKIVGVTEFVMRMPVLIAHLLFLFYSAKLLKIIDNKWLMMAAFIVLNVNPYMLDFFSVARGYGLSIGLMMASIYYFYLFHSRENKNKQAFVSLLFAAFAVFANFVLLNYFLVLSGLIVLLNIYYTTLKTGTLKEKTIIVLKGIAVPVALIIIVFIMVIPIALGLKEAGALFFGGEKSFWSDTISTITDRCFYELGYDIWFQRLAKGFVFLVLILSSIYFVLRFFNKQVNTNRLFLGSLLLLIGMCSLSTVIQHHLMQTPYLLDRTALFLVVLFNLVFVFFIVEISKEKHFSVYVLHTSSVVLLIHFFMCFNLLYVLEWKNDANVKEMLTDLEKIKRIPKEKETISIGIPLIFDPAINFYREKNELTWLNTAWRGHTASMQHDYFCLSQKDIKEFNMDSLEIIKTYPVTGNMLAKPKYLPKEIKVALEKTITFENEKDQRFFVNESVEYSPGFSYIVNDSLTPNRTGVFAFYAEVMAPDLSDNNLIMVISFQDEKANLYSWQKAYIKDFIKNENDWFRTSFTCIIPPETKPADEIKAYIWNPDKHELYIRKLEFKWLSYAY
jgi:hypothetical protein